MQTIKSAERTNHEMQTEINYKLHKNTYAYINVQICMYEDIYAYKGVGQHH